MLGLAAARRCACLRVAVGALLTFATRGGGTWLRAMGRRMLAAGAPSSGWLAAAGPHPRGDERFVPSRELFGGISRGGRCARAWTRCPDRSCRSGPIARCRRAWHQDRPPRCSSTQPGLDTGRAAVDPHPKPSVTTMEVVLYRTRSARDVTDSAHQHGSRMDAHRAFEGSLWIAILLCGACSERSHNRADGLPDFNEHVLVVIEVLNDRIAAADKQLKDIARQHPVCSLLMTIPGAGPVTSVRFVAALDDVRRFPDAHSVQAYLGLVPGEHSSATRQRRTGITNAGPSRVRWTLDKSAWVFLRFNKSDPLTLWCLEVEKRRGSKIAVTALARRLAGVMYAMWRDGTRYEPSKLRPHTTA